MRQFSAHNQFIDDLNRVALSAVSMV